MLAILTVLATIATAAIKTEEMSCTIVANLTHWELNSMKATEDVNGTLAYYSRGPLTWNMCQYIDPLNAPNGYGSDTKSFAYLNLNGTISPLTSEMIPAAKSHQDSNGNIDGLTYTFKSDSVCSFNSNETFGFQNTVICNKNVTGAGSVVSTRDEYTCLPKVTMEHASACPTVSFTGVVKFLDENVWLSGTILVVFGAIMAMFGRAFFRWIMAVFATLAGFMVAMYFFSLFGWLVETWVIVVLCIVALSAGLAAGAAIYYFIPVAMVLLGLAAGLFMGAVIFSLVVGISGYDELWLMITLCIVLSLVSGWISWKFKLGYLSFATAFVGGYLFMRGFTFWCGGYPSEMEMIQIVSDGGALEFTWAFWVYIGVFIASSLFGYIWQIRFYKNSDSDLDDYYGNDF